jgi:hypothetical protein
MPTPRSDRRHSVRAARRQHHSDQCKKPPTPYQSLRRFAESWGTSGSRATDNDTSVGSSGKTGPHENAQPSSGHTASKQHAPTQASAHMQHTASAAAGGLWMGNTTAVRAARRSADSGDLGGVCQPFSSAALRHTLVSAAAIHKRMRRDERSHPVRGSFRERVLVHRRRVWGHALLAAYTQSMRRSVMARMRQSRLLAHTEANVHVAL